MSLVDECKIVRLLAVENNRENLLTIIILVVIACLDSHTHQISGKCTESRLIGEGWTCGVLRVSTVVRLTFARSNLVLSDGFLPSLKRVLVWRNCSTSLSSSSLISFGDFFLCLSSTRSLAISFGSSSEGEGVLLSSMAGSLSTLEGCLGCRSIVCFYIRGLVDLSTRSSCFYAFYNFSGFYGLVTRTGFLGSTLQID